MPSLSDIYSHSSIKLLLMGHSGSGKTGALASLALAGYKLRIFDFDRGLESLFHQLSDLPNDSPELKAKKKVARENVLYNTFTDSIKFQGKFALTQGAPKAWTNATLAMNKFPGDPIGGLNDWDDTHVVVIDSLTFVGEAIMRHVLYLNGRAAALRQQSDWGDAMNLQEAMLAALYDDSVKAHVVVISHITTAREDGGILDKGFPSALGSKLPPKVGRYFNAVLMIEQKAGTRTIHTKPKGLVDLKNPNPTLVPDELPISTGLADYFRIIRRQ